MKAAMKATAKNTIFVTVGAWKDWEEKTKVLRASAKKQGVPLEIVDKGGVWHGYFENKIVRLKSWLEDRVKENKKIKYFVFVDARDVVFIKPLATILKQMQGFSEENVWFNPDRRNRTWPANSRWFAHRISLKYGCDGIANSGLYFGRVERVLDLLARCIDLSWFLTDETVRPGSIENLIKETIRGDRPDLKFVIGKGDTTTTEYRLGTYPAAEPFLQSDQFYVQLLQAMWDDIVQVDIERKVLAGFADGWPSYGIDAEGLTTNGWVSNGSMPLGTAGILHSPWMFPRTKMDDKNNVDAWTLWAIREGIVNERDLES